MTNSNEVRRRVRLSLLAGIGLLAITGISQIGGGATTSPLEADSLPNSTESPSGVLQPSPDRGEPAADPTPDPRTTDGIIEILEAVRAEDAAKQRFEGWLGPFEIGADESRFALPAYYACSYSDERKGEQFVPSELDFITRSPNLTQAVCDDGTVTLVQGAEGEKWYFSTIPAYVYAEAPAERLELMAFRGLDALLERSIYASVPYGDFGEWKLWIIERVPSETKPGILVRVTAPNYEELIHNAEVVLGLRPPFVDEPDSEDGVTSPAQAFPNYMLRWMASPSANWMYCFGMAGWHGVSGTAADIWTYPCFENTHSYVYAITYGQRQEPAAQQLLGVALSTTGTLCYSASVDVYQAPSGTLNWVYIGRESYTHVIYDGAGSPFYDIQIGYQTWLFAQKGLGYEQDPDKPGCRTDGPHPHIQTCRHPSPYPLADVRNPFLSPLGWYPQHDLWYYLHRWDWSSVPSSPPPGVC